jgi:hypothetical protein
MPGIRSWVKRLERASRKEEISIPQRDGSIRRFPKSAAKDAYLNATLRLGAGEDAPPPHPLLLAAKNSTVDWWRESVYASGAQEAWTEPVEDLSEP